MWDTGVKVVSVTCDGLSCHFSILSELGARLEPQNLRVSLFECLVEQQQAPLKYLLLYKFSQDHLELFFGAVRSAGGFNNNLTTQQFTAAYKRLLLRSSIEGAKGNCTKEDPTDILFAIGKNSSVGTNVSMNNASIARKYDLLPLPPVPHDHDYSDAPKIASLSEFKQASISYIAGYVAKRTRKQICVSCCEALGSTNHKAEAPFTRCRTSF